MGPGSRSSSYHHGNLRAALVETGLEMAREAGPEGVALREVARRVGVSHNAAYRHFADRDELLTEIAHRAMDRLAARMQERIAAVVDESEVARARRRLSEVGRAYVEFALEEPGLFRVAFSSKSEAAGEEAPGARVDVGPYGLLTEVLDELVEVGYLDPSRRLGSDVACWAAVHGFAQLCLDGPVGLLPLEVRDAALDRLLETVERGLGSPSGARVGAHPTDVGRRRSARDADGSDDRVQDS